MTTTVITDNTTGGTYTGFRGSKILEGFPTANWDGNSFLECQRYGSSNWASSVLVATGCTNIATDQSVSSATLSLKINGSGGSDSGYQAGIYQLLVSFVENEVTWNKRNSSTNWGTPGATGSGDSGASALAQYVLGIGSSGYIDFTGSALTSYIQTCVSAGTAPYFLLRKDGGGTNDSTYYTFSSYAASDGDRPKLTVVHTTAAASVTDPQLQAMSRGMPRGMNRGMN